MKILILSFYYEPDLCAGSFRTSALVEQLKKYPNIKLDIITTMPNRYSSFNTSAETNQSSENLSVHRIVLPSHESGMLDQIKSFKTFYFEVMQKVKHNKYDLVYATSSRLFTAFLAARIANINNIPLYLDIRDIFVDTIKDVLSPILVGLIKPFLSIIEKYTFSSANHINLVSRGFEKYFSTKYSDVSYSWFTNGIDKEFLTLTVLKKKPQSIHKINSILYAGNIGEGQGLHKIVHMLADFTNDTHEIIIVGDGGRKAQLLSSVRQKNNVKLLPPVNRATLIKKYLDADILFLHLNNHEAFEKVLPSKIFEYAATGKPILAGVSGFAAKFITEEVPNAEVFHPGDAHGAYRALKRLRIINTNRKDFIDKYTRTNIMQEMAKSIVHVASK